jgi:hypothetical protein
MAQIGMLWGLRSMAQIGACHHFLSLRSKPLNMVFLSPGLEAPDAAGCRRVLGRSPFSLCRTDYK